MRIDSCLVLSAGFGTRMGELGRRFPKPLWPLFDRTLLYFQIQQALQIGCKRIYINVHHQADLIKGYVDSLRSDVRAELIVLEEQEILDSGGGVHNCLQFVDDAYLLVLNADVLLDLSSVDWSRIDLTESAGIIFMMPVEEDSEYNRLKIVDNQLVEILPPADGRSLLFTYAGCAVINGAEIPRQLGKSRFFDTVLNFKKQRVLVSRDIIYEQVDLGTYENYVQGIEQLLLRHSPKHIWQCLVDMKIIQHENQNNEYYAKRDSFDYAIRTDKVFCGTFKHGEKGVVIRE